MTYSCKGNNYVKDFDDLVVHFGSIVFVKLTVNSFLHLHEIGEELYFHCSLSVCKCLFVCLNACKQNSNQKDAPI